MSGSRFNQYQPNGAFPFAPGVEDDGQNDWQIGSRWLDTATGNLYTCTDTTPGAAVWSSGGGSIPPANVTITGQVNPDTTIEYAAGQAGPDLVDVLIGTINFSSDQDNLISLDLGNLSALSDYGCRMFSSASLEAVDGSNVLYSAGGITFTNCASLESVNFPVLTSAFQLQLLGNTLLSIIDFSSLAYTSYNVQLSQCPALSAISFPMLTTAIGSIDISAMATLSVLQLPALTSCSYITITSNPMLPSITLPSIVEIITAGINISNNDILDTFIFGNGLLRVSGGFVANGTTMLATDSVDDILVTLAGLDGTGGTTSYDNNTIDLTGACQAPSATGLAAKAVLEARGNTVTVNP